MRSRAAATSSRRPAAIGDSAGSRPRTQVRVGHRRLGAAAAVTRRTGVGARAVRPDPQRAAAVDPCDRAAARADRVDVDHRQPHRQPGDAPVHRQLGLAAALGEEERVAARAAHVEAERRRGRATIRAATAPPAGPESSIAAGCAAACSSVATPPEDSITCGSGRPGLRGRARRSRREVAAGRRPERGVDRRGGGALELAHLRRHLVRGDHERVRQRLAQDLRHARLVRGVEEREQQADGDRLGALAREPPRGPVHARLVELAQHARGPHPLVDLEAPARSTTGGVGASCRR